ncbi:MAG TPA: galactokinase [Actinomycetota bacterium]|nr:galactokinase [Actinomycetota bacterium]
MRACLAGEDLDWLGGECCCVALDLPTTVSLTAGQPAPAAYLTATWRAVGGIGEPPPLRVLAAAPVASGLSTSTSLIVALLQACASLSGAGVLAAADLAGVAYEIEFAFDRGGGMDQATIVQGGVRLMSGAPRGLPRLLAEAPWPAAFALAVIASTEPKSTRDHIARVRGQLAHGDPLLAEYAREASQAARRAWDALSAVDLVALQRAVNDAHRAMRDRQRMSTPVLEGLRAAALRVGFGGVKLSGAGGGGALIAVDTAAAVPRLATELRRALRPAQAEVIPARAAVAGWYPPRRSTREV